MKNIKFSEKEKNRGEEYQDLKSELEQDESEKSSEDKMEKRFILFL